MAGIKLERVPIPSDDDMIAAKNKDILKKLVDVDMDVLPTFKESAQLLIKQHGGNAEKAV